MRQKEPSEFKPFKNFIEFSFIVRHRSHTVRWVVIHCELHSFHGIPLSIITIMRIKVRSEFALATIMAPAWFAFGGFAVITLAIPDEYTWRTTHITQRRLFRTVGFVIFCLIQPFNNVEHEPCFLDVLESMHRISINCVIRSSLGSLLVTGFIKNTKELSEVLLDIDPGCLGGIVVRYFTVDIVQCSWFVICLTQLYKILFD